NHLWVFFYFFAKQTKNNKLLKRKTLFFLVFDLKFCK
ncbi:unnamed protein product, partial [Staurois parvus]